MRKTPRQIEWAKTHMPYRDRFHLTNEEFDDVVRRSRMRSRAVKAARRVLVYGEQTGEAAKAYPGLSGAVLRDTIWRLIQVMKQNAFRCDYCGKLVPEKARTKERKTDA